MVAHLVRLKLTLLRNTFKRSRAQAIGVVLAVLYGGFFVLLAAVGLAALREWLDVARVVVPLGGAAAIILWSLVPILAFGSDPTLDPSRFATYAVPIGIWRRDSSSRVSSASPGSRPPSSLRPRSSRGRTASWPRPSR